MLRSHFYYFPLWICFLICVMKTILSSHRAAVRFPWDNVWKVHPGAWRAEGLSNSTLDPWDIYTKSCFTLSAVDWASHSRSIASWQSEIAPPSWQSHLGMPWSNFPQCTQVFAAQGLPVLKIMFRALYGLHSRWCSVDAYHQWNAYGMFIHQVGFRQSCEAVPELSLLIPTSFLVCSCVLIIGHPWPHWTDDPYIVTSQDIPTKARSQASPQKATFLLPHLRNH